MGINCLVTLEREAWRNENIQPLCILSIHSLNIQLLCILSYTASIYSRSVYCHCNLSIYSLNIQQLYILSIYSLNIQQSLRLYIDHYIDHHPALWNTSVHLLQFQFQVYLLCAVLLNSMKFIIELSKFSREFHVNFTVLSKFTVPSKYCFLCFVILWVQNQISG